MVKFEKTITVEVQVDSIAERLLDSLDKENPHRELITEEIIGNLLESNRLGDLFNALNGFRTEIDFKIGQIVNSDKAIWDYRDSNDKSDTVQRKIGVCKIVGINRYEKDVPVTVEYWNFRRDMTPVLSTTNVRIKSLTATEFTELPEAIDITTEVNRGIYEEKDNSQDIP